MRKTLGFLACVIVVLLLIIVLCATNDNSLSDTTEPQDMLWNQFVIVDSQFSLLHGTLYTVYDKDSKAMYYYTYGRYDKNLVAIYNEDGTVKYYKGETTNE